VACLDQQITKLEKLKIQYSKLLSDEEKVIKNLHTRVKHLTDIQNAVNGEGNQD
jgi:hypothetical protein